MNVMVRWICVLAVMLAAGSAEAQPVSFEIKAEVPVGQKPLMRIRAEKQVTDVRVELKRDDGKRFAMRHAALSRGQAVTLAIGDGAAGRARYEGTLSVQLGDGGRWSHDLAFVTLVRAPLRVTYDFDHLDLDRRVLEFKLSRPARKAQLVVIGEDGEELGRGSATYRDPSPDTWLRITWTQPPDTRVMVMRLRVAAADGLATNVELIPWSVTIDHEDVNFRTNSAVIEPGEFGKLDASLEKINEIVARSGRFMKMKLYIAGHTDTVGSAASNRKLSLDRAHAIARYFRRKGLAIPIAVAGFGEHVLRVPTPDQTDEPANRRADYVLGPADGSPPFKGPYLKVRAAWREVR
jgi:outer membrane protein OmpA-like peptidoglycan-associated protein